MHRYNGWCFYVVLFVGMWICDKGHRSPGHTTEAASLCLITLQLQFTAISLCLGPNNGCLLEGDGCTIKHCCCRVLKEFGLFIKKDAQPCRDGKGTPVPSSPYCFISGFVLLDMDSCSIAQIRPIFTRCSCWEVSTFPDPPLQVVFRLQSGLASLPTVYKLLPVQF